MRMERFNQPSDADEQPGNKPIETDSEKIVHRHLRDKDDVITDEDIRSIRVGIPNEPEITNVATGTPVSDESANDTTASNSADASAEPPSEEPLTPWDVIK